ncbi:MAG: hypothetical protein GF311_22065 [Candidatus Lokiarchaeota archaeon]|nr:hypothetical protein [Candidatus Lokiarchaeota archaeon]
MNHTANKGPIIDLGSYSIKMGQASFKTPEISIRALFGGSEDSNETIFGDVVLQEHYIPEPPIEYKWDIIQMKWDKLVKQFTNIFEGELKIS